MNIQALINSLLGPLTQNQRLLKLHTPRGPDVLVAERARILDAIGPHPMLPKDCPQDWSNAAGLRLEIDALSADGHLETKQLMAQSVRLELLTEQGQRSWSGRVHGCRFLGSDGGLARYRLIVEPWLAFLRHRIDAYVFQDQTVPEILDTVFGDSAHAAFAPAWRWDLEDPSIYPKRSLCIQYQESDLDFVERLLREEGIHYRWEHEGDVHTLVLSDYNDSFPENAKASVRYTQSGSVFKEDSLTQVHSARRLATNQLHWASRDHRSTQLRPVGSSAGGPIALELADIPGAYAYPTQADGQRLLDRQLEALQSQAAQMRAAGPWRAAAPGTRFTLLEHGRESGQELLVTASYHQARNNVSADLRAGLLALDAHLVHGERSGELANEREEPLHHVELLWQPFAQTYRAGSGPKHFKRPLIAGLQTAIVVGEGEPPIPTATTASRSSSTGSAAAKAATAWTTPAVPTTPPPTAAASPGCASPQESPAPTGAACTCRAWARKCWSPSRAATSTAHLSSAASTTARASPTPRAPRRPQARPPPPATPRNGFPATSKRTSFKPTTTPTSWPASRPRSWPPARPAWAATTSSSSTTRQVAQGLSSRPPRSRQDCSSAA